MLPSLLGPRTRLVAVGAASNAIGTLNDIAAIVAVVRQHCGALVFVDAVQLVPHLPVDVRALGCDLLVCSPYKFFGPHQGVLWGRAALLETIAAYKVRPARTLPAATRFETGTPSFEAQAGVSGTIAYLEGLGALVGGDRANDRATRLRIAMTACAEYERDLGRLMLAGLATIPGLTLYGPPTMVGRVPTFAFTIDGYRPEAIARALAERNIFVWSGHFYAVEVIARLGLAETGGLVRVGLAHYTTENEVDALIAALREVTRPRSEAAE